MQLTPGKYAAYLGVPLDTLQVAAKRLHMPWQPGIKLVDVEMMDSAWQAAYRRGAVKTPAPGQDEDESAPGELEAAKLRKAKADADLVELKVAKLGAELVPVSEIELAWFGITAGFDSLLDALPAKISARLGGDKREVMRVTREVIRKEREGLAQRIEVEAQEAEAAAAVQADDDDELEAAAAPKKRGRGRPRKDAP